MKAMTLIASVVVLLIAGGVCIHYVAGTADDGPADVDPWQYDDYRTIPGVTAASGSLELVEHSDGVYVHAHGVGRGTYSVGDVVTEVSVSKAVLDVVLMSGQSNSTYIPRFVENGDASPLPSPGTAYVWAQSDGNYSLLYTPGIASMFDMVTVDGVARTGAVAPAFAAAYTEETGNKVYFVAGGIPAKAISWFNPENGTAWAYMQQCLDNAMAAIDTTKFIPRTTAYMWIQGESDKNTDVDLYKSRFLSMHHAILDGGLGHSFRHCFISLPAEDDSTNAYAAQVELAQEHPDTITIATDLANTFTVENGLLQSDLLHYTSEGYNMIGTALGESMGSWYVENPIDVPVSSIDMSYLVPIFSVIIGFLAITAVLAYFRSD